MPIWMPQQPKRRHVFSGKPARRALVGLALLGCTLAHQAQAAPRIVQVMDMPGGEVTLTGSAFGTGCAQCEVRADYGLGWHYALPVSSWTDSRIVARLPDLNAGLDVQVSVHTGEGVSAPVRARVRRERLPAQEQRLPVRSDVPGLRVFELRSTLKVGDSGEEHYDLSATAPRCGERALLFDLARLLFVRQRFAQAVIVAAPDAGCTACGPLRVRWYHEPTGHLELQVHVYHRRVEGICAQRMRR
jgi:hypothetical protein